MKPAWDVLQSMSKSSTVPLTPQVLTALCLSPILRPQITPVEDSFLNYISACILTPVSVRWGYVVWKNTVKNSMQNLPGSPNSLESISSFCCSSFSLSFFCFFSISLFLSSSCSPSSITLNALSSASYSSVRVLSNVLRLSTWFSNASSAEGGGQTPEQKEKWF